MYKLKLMSYYLALKHSVALVWILRQSFYRIKRDKQQLFSEAVSH